VPELLYVGDSRPEKGYELLCQSIAGLSFTIRQIGGHAPDAVRVTDDDLAEAYQRCDLVVCPYSDDYENSGSGSLVASEAIAYGAPLLATPSLREAFPLGYRGVRFADAATVGALRDALLSIDVEEFGRATRTDAPAIAEQRTADAYVRGLLAWVE
jgi:glycosyltransferase involved in cell wall biosynthesis